MGDHGAAAGHLLQPHLGSRLITGWLCNRAGSSVLIAGLFHSMHNAIVNSTGLVAVVELPQFEVLVIMAGIVVLGAAIIAVATRGVSGSTDHQEAARRPEYGDATMIAMSSTTVLHDSRADRGPSEDPGR
jgi:F0F1-type ATP synthase membrane subunit c/vacuolar-type H+-ATPase subunit K